MTPRESLHRDYGLLAGFLRGVSFRFQLRTILEFLLLLPSGFILILLGSLFALKLGEASSYLPFCYSIFAILSLSILIALGLWRVVRRPCIERVARGLEEKFPQLRDDVTNSLSLFHEVKKGPIRGQISEGLIAAQLRKTANEISAIMPGQVVSLKAALKHLRILLPLALTFSVVLAADPSFLSRSLALITHPQLPARESSILLEPRGATVLRGASVFMRAEVTGYVPDKLMLEVWPEDRQAMHLSMKPEGDGRFAYQLDSVQFSFQYQARSGRAASTAYSLRVIDPPEVGRIKLTIIPPDYTGLSEETKEEGHIEALKGSVANLEVQATKEVKEAKMILNQESELPLRIQGDRLTGNLLVFYPGTYSIKVKDDLGFENQRPVAYQIRLIPDKYPEAEIVSPAKDLEISGNEVIPIVYTASDDFGITSARLSYQMGGMERFINLKSPTNVRSLGPETFKWDLGSLILTAGDRVIYRLEVSDNDTVSGPKVGYSRTFSLTVRDEKSRATREVEEAQRVSDALLDLLADQLEETKDRETLGKGLDAVLKRVDKSLEQMGERVERFDLEALKRNLTSLKERVSQESKETVTQELERLSLLAEEIAKRARMNEVETLAKELRNRQRRLVDFLDELKASPTREGLEAAMKELRKLAELLRSVMETMSKLATQLPDEFINSQELSGLDFQDLFKDLEEIHKKLLAGDIAGALEAAQRLLQALSEMMAALGRAGAQAGMAQFDRLQGEMSRQAGELDKILAEQKEVLRETERVNEAIKEKLEEETGKRLDRSLSRLEEILEKLERLLLPEQKDFVRELGMLLKGKNLERFSHLAKDLEKELSQQPEDRDLIKELEEMIESLTPDLQEFMAQDQREKFPDLSSRQGNLAERTQRLREKLEMIAQLFPGMDTEILNDLREVRGSMGKASERLGEKDAPGAIPPEQDAIRRLSKSQQAMQQMAQQMAMRMQAARWGYPLAYDPRPGWYYGPWIPMPTLPQPEVRRPTEKGFTGIDREEFEPPSKDAYQVPKMFREKIMESLKEEIPSQYKRDVERYFRGLTE